MTRTPSSAAVGSTTSTARAATTSSGVATATTTSAPGPATTSSTADGETTSWTPRWTTATTISSRAMRGPTGSGWTPTTTISGISTGARGTLPVSGDGAEIGQALPAVRNG